MYSGEDGMDILKENPHLQIDVNYIMTTTSRTQEEHQSALSKVIPKKLDVHKLIPYFAYRPVDVIQKTLENTT